MQPTSRRSEFQRVKCIRDNNIYIFKLTDNPNYYSEDFALIRCYKVGKNQEVDFSKETEIYGKDLISLYDDEF
jgi:hypothetical protein